MIDEVVADKPYHSNQVLVHVVELTFKSSNQLTSSLRPWTHCGLRRAATSHRTYAVSEQIRKVVDRCEAGCRRSLACARRARAVAKIAFLTEPRGTAVWVYYYSRTQRRS